jgi:hypothetical protein
VAIPAPPNSDRETTATSAPPVSALVDLLTTWQLWTYRDHLIQQIAAARQAHDTHRVFTLTHQLNTAPGVTALKALAANHQLTTLLLDGQGQAIRAARKAGASWDQIATATGTTTEQACADCLAHAEHPKPTRTAGHPTQ